MKRIICALLLTCLAVPALAAAPPGLMNYQGVLRNASNAPQSGAFDMEFAFYDDTDPDCGDGTLLLTDSHLVAGTGDVTVTGGLFNTLLGGGAVAAGVESTLTGVFANHTSVFMEVRVEGGGGGLETLCPRIRVVSTGYSLSADSLDGLDSTSFINTSAGAQFKAGHLGVGTLNVSGATITFTDGPAILAQPGGFTLIAGDDLADDFLVKMGPSILDGGIDISGGGNFQFHSPGGPFQFYQGGIERASLSTTGNLQLDGDVDVDGNDITFGNPGASATASATSLTLTGGDAATDDLILRATTGGDGAITINGDAAMAFFAGNGSFSWIDAATATTRATLDNLGNFQLDGILDEDLAISIGTGTVATVTTNAAVFTIGGANLDLNLGDSPADNIDVIGNFSATGTKAFVQNHPYARDLSIYYVALEGDEAGTYTRGSARVWDGVARVRLGETFAWVTNPDIGLTAQVTPRGEWADLYVESVTPNELIVRSRDASVPAAFDYVVYGLRIGHEDFPVVRQKTSESSVPSETAYAQKYYVNRPELRAYSPLARFQRMEVDADVAHREPIASRALRQALGEHALSEDLARPQTQVGAAASPIATADNPAGDRSSRDGVDDTEALAGSAPPSAEEIANARSLRPIADHLESLVEVAEPVGDGDILVIDAEGSGSMSLSRTAADSAVFGVVAYAGAAELSGTSTIAAGGGKTMQVPVALSGIVHCNVDARFGPIRAGDLLTTSTTPGHAMRAQNPRPGTIVGKALEPLGAGTGRIKVLVILH